MGALLIVSRFMSCFLGLCFGVVIVVVTVFLVVCGFIIMFGHGVF